MNPTANNFPQIYQFSGYLIEYINFREICQGGPEVGNLIINSKNIFPKLEFGGPLYFHNSIIYVPKFVKHGFILVEIDLVKKKIKQISDVEPLILIKDIEENIIKYFNDIECRNIIKINLNLYENIKKRTTCEKVISILKSLLLRKT
ncbi:MAG: hypothetical protein FGM14_16020 [Flavobacteriales bacterium]|nr:hypothetical protein [Flavobacteriales bacterium]